MYLRGVMDGTSVRNPLVRRPFRNTHGYRYFQGVLHRHKMRDRGQPPRQDREGRTCRRNLRHRHGEEIRRDQDALRGARKPLVPQTELRQGRRGPGEGERGHTVPDRHQHHVRGEEEACGRAPGDREPERIQPHVHGMPDNHRGRTEGDR